MDAMPVSTRDLQRERRKSQLYAMAPLATTGRLSLTGIDNESFLSSSHTDLPTSHPPLQSPTTMPLVHIAEEQEAPGSTTSTQRSHHPYRWKMSHYFYIHVSLFIIDGLVGGLIIWLIENYSASRNKLMEVLYIDAWFVSSSCVCSCGLTTLEFAQLSHASQMVLMVLTFISGITISTLPALVVKAQTHKRVDEPTVDDDHGEFDEDENDELATSNSRLDRNLPPHIRSQLFSLPNAVQLRYRAYITCIVLILATCFTIYTIAFVVIGSWLQTHYTPEDLLQDNSSVNPWYASFIITLTGFNQNGLTPFSTGFRRFVDDVYLNLFVMMVKNIKQQTCCSA
jgi:hypothetical protein